MTSTSTDRRFGVTSSAAIKVPCKAATTANITLSGEQTIDGVSCVTDDRVLVKDQTDSVDNGIWVVGTSTWQRSKDFDGSYDIVKGTIVHVHSGTTNANTFWKISTADPITIGTTSISFQLSLTSPNVSSFAQTLLDDTTSNAFLTTLTHTRSESGAVERTVISILRENLKVLDFIPVNLHAGILAGTNVTNLHTYINNAIAALNASSAYTKRLIFPAGTYLIGGKLTTYSNIHWFADSLGSVTIKAAASLNDRLVVNSARDVGSGSDTNVVLENLIFDCNGANQTGSTALTFSRTDGHRVINCEFKNPYDSLYLLTGASDVTLNTNAVYENVYFNGSGQVSAADVVDIGSGTNIRISRCRAFSAKTGSGSTMLSLAIVNQLTMSECKVDGDGKGACVTLYGIRGGKLDGNELMNSAEAGMRIQHWGEITPEKDFSGFEVVNNNIHDNAFEGIWVNHDGEIDELPKNIKISHNDIWNNQRAAIKALVADGLKISDNDIWNNSLAGVGSHYVFNFDGAFTGSEHVKNILVYGNRIFDTQGTPTQTRLFLLDYVSNLRSYDNQVSQISTYSTETNSTNVYVMGSRRQTIITFPFALAAGQTNKFIAVLDANYSRTTDFKIERLSFRLENSTGGGQSASASVTDGTTTMTASISASISATTTTNAFVWDVSGKDLTIRYTSSAGCAAGNAVITITGYELESE